jgi:hypothetical protein
MYGRAKRGREKKRRVGVLWEEEGRDGGTGGRRGAGGDMVVVVVVVVVGGGEGGVLPYTTSSGSTGRVVHRSLIVLQCRYSSVTAYLLWCHKL